MNKIALFIGLLSCATSEVEPKKPVSKVSTTVNCAFDEAKVLQELTKQCVELFKHELDKFKERKCKGEKIKIESKLYRSRRMFPDIRL